MEDIQNECEFFMGTKYTAQPNTPKAESYSVTEALPMDDGVVRWGASGPLGKGQDVEGLDHL